MILFVLSSPLFQQIKWLYNTAIMQYHVYIYSINKKQEKNSKRVKSDKMSERKKRIYSIRL